MVKKQVSVYNWNDDKKYTNRPEWFYDMTHLNENGAITFTKDFCQRLKMHIARYLFRNLSPVIVKWIYGSGMRKKILENK